MKGSPPPILTAPSSKSTIKSWNLTPTSSSNSSVLWKSERNQTSLPDWQSETGLSAAIFQELRGRESIRALITSMVSRASHGSVQDQASVSGSAVPTMLLSGGAMM